MKLTKEILAPLIEERLSTSAMAKRIGCSQAHVWRSLKTLGLTSKFTPTNRISPTHCKECGKKVPHKRYRFCSHKCRRDNDYHIFIAQWLAENIDGGTLNRVSSYVRRYLIETFGNRCMSPTCGWDWKKPCSVEVEHKDGNPHNHHKDNLMLICPNCHTQTPTYKGKNNGKGRHQRMERYNAGLSY